MCIAQGSNLSSKYSKVHKVGVQSASNEVVETIDDYVEIAIFINAHAYLVREKRKERKSKVSLNNLNPIWVDKNTR
jgi:hypothetical protein